MKFQCFIGAIFLMLTAACHRPVETVGTPSPPPELMAIDTLMQTRPDSALTLLLDEAVDDPYYQLLLSEALYKNDYAQANRTELLTAMTHFDSIDDPFLSARCHYMNGVGYYEMDSVVSACAEYLKALEIMENRFEEKDLVGYKAKFMALTYTRLCKLFSDQYLHEQAIHFGKDAALYYNRYDAEPWHITWVLDEIGVHYQMMGALDSAIFYYDKTIEMLPDTNNITYRDVETARTLLSYQTGKEFKIVLEKLYGLLALSEDDNEYLSRCLIIGNVYFFEQQYDSAWKYLSKVFEESHHIDHKKQTAEWLIDICKHQEKQYGLYVDFLLPFVNQEENNSGIKSQITKQSNEYHEKKQNAVYNKLRQLLKKGGLIVIGILLLLGIGIVLSLFMSKRKSDLLQIKMEETAKQLENERLAHRVQQAALCGRLKQKNLALKEINTTHEIKPKQVLLPEVTIEDYATEPICQHILNVCNDKQNPIKSTIPSSAYADIALNDQQKAQLKDAAIRHFGNMFENIKKQHPGLKEKDFQYCYLCLLELNNVQIAALLQKSTSTIWDREKRLQEIFGRNERIAIVLNSLMNV